MAKITYQDKVFLNKNEEIADQNKVNDTDLNEIKNVVNENAILNSLSEIGLSEITTLDSIVTAVPNGKTLQLYLSNDDASILYGTSGGTGNLPTNIAGILTVQKNSGNNWVYITYTTNYAAYESDKAGIFYTTKFNDYRNWTNFNNLFKFQTLSVPISIAGNAHAAFQMGWLDTTAGYSYLGILSKESGFGDQWTITYSLYQGNKIYADVRNNYSQTLSGSISCTVVYVKSDYLTKAIVGD